QTTTVLSVGQILQVPAAKQAAINGMSVQSLPDLKAVPVIPPQAASPQSVSSVVVKQKQTAIEGLKQNRDRLKQSLAELKSEESAKPQSTPVTTPVATLPQANTPQVATYRVNPGETLSSIAQAHGISASDLADLNRLSNPNLVQANQFIKVPQKVAQALSQPVAATEPQAPANVQVPTVPSLASTQNPVNPSVPLAVGGDAGQFAFANSSRNRTPEAQPADLRRSDDQYVNTLLSEISRLRERYQARSANRESAKISNAETSVSSRRVNPQFKPNRPVAALRTESRNAAASGQTRLERVLANAPKPKPQVVATATLGSESYTPILRSPVGKTVSPNLPPLGRSDAYMPGDRFKGYMWPAKGMLTSPYGWRWGRMHKGIDIAAHVGTPIMAAASGKVITAGWNDGGYGNLVEVQHTDGSVTLYAHNSRLLVRVGQQVRQGQQIAEMGSTGFSTGPHSHFEVHLPGRGAVNPIALLPQSRG
ncbi:MAG: peptidase M23, partial [Leptolyngbya sp. ERB_1_2]